MVLEEEETDVRLGSLSVRSVTCAEALAPHLKAASTADLHLL